MSRVAPAAWVSCSALFSSQLLYSLHTCYVLITPVMFSSHLLYSLHTYMSSQLLYSLHTCYILITAVVTFSSHLLHSLHTCVPHPQTYAEVLNTNAIPLRPSVAAVRFLSCALLFVAPWTADRQAALSMGFLRQEY